MTNTAQPQRRALREPMVWMIILLPLAAVIASITTVVIATRASGKDDVIDRVQRTAQVQRADLHQDDAAHARNISMVLSVRDDHVELTPVTGDVAKNTSLTVVLAHPTDGSQDQTLQAQPSEHGWQAAFTSDQKHAWDVHVLDANKTWRIRGRLAAGAQAVHLGSHRSAP